jgi:hypothetical protein
MMLGMLDAILKAGCFYVVRVGTVSKVALSAMQVASITGPAYAWSYLK